MDVIKWWWFLILCGSVILDSVQFDWEELLWIRLRCFGLGWVRLGKVVLRCFRMCPGEFLARSSGLIIHTYLFLCDQAFLNGHAQFLLQRHEDSEAKRVTCVNITELNPLSQEFRHQRQTTLNTMLS